MYLFINMLFLKMKSLNFFGWKIWHIKILLMHFELFTQKLCELLKFWAILVLAATSLAFVWISVLIPNVWYFGRSQINIEGHIFHQKNWAILYIFWKNHVSDLLGHCSPESNLVNFGPPKKPTTDLECSWHGDFGSEVGFGASSSATETVISL